MSARPLGSSSYYSLLRYGFVVGRRACGERVPVWRPGVPPFALTILPSQVVKRGPQLLECVADDEGNGCGGGGAKPDTLDLLSRLRIVLSDQNPSLFPSQRSAPVLALVPM